MPNEETIKSALDVMNELEKSVSEIAAAVPTFDADFLATLKTFAAKTTAFYTPKLFTPEQGPEVEKVLYLAALYGADKYTRHECKKLAAEILAVTQAAAENPKA